MFDLSVNFTFKLGGDRLPEIDEQYQKMYLFAKLVKAYTPIESWFLTANKKADALLHNAFSESGVRGEAITRAKALDTESDFRALGVWNGVEGRRGASISTIYRIPGLGSLRYQASGFDELKSYVAVAEVVDRALQLCPASLVEVGPFKYFSQKQVFPDRPGVGWMLYLPRRIEIGQVPEARMLRHVTDLNGCEGTIIVSEIDDGFSADDVDDVKIANQIEIRLADQDLLPKYRDL